MNKRNQNPLQKLVSDHKNCSSTGIYSVCSAHEYVLRAAMMNAKRDNTSILIEATCNQVNQFGGYTGMTPAMFASYVHDIAEVMDFSRERLILGGDHLGPHVWQDEPAESAMKKACDMVRDYVRAGFTKIHLDASMPCADDISPLSDETVAARSVAMCAVVEKYGADLPQQPVYVIGTEVPVPGGTKEDEQLQVTGCDAVERFITVSRDEFRSRSLESAWDRVIAVVVQPGVEFGSHTIIDYDRPSASSLSRFIESYDSMVFEAHSTDYQKKESLRQMVEDHFCILKVGPWLTYAFREGVFALAAMEQELLGKKSGVELSNLRKVIDDVMLEDPRYWEKYYPGDEAERAFERVYSLSDRIRYYWQNPKAKKALGRLMKNLDIVNIPLSLVSQYFPMQYDALREGKITATPSDLLLGRIAAVLEIYSYACGMA